MKHLILILALLPTMAYAQYPINETFNTGAPGWTFTNGAGIQANSYATFNINTTPYPSNDTVAILSPIYDFTDCPDIEVDFAWRAPMTDPADVWSFDYFDGTSWVTVDSWSSASIPWVLENYLIPNNAVQFRFLLITDAPDIQTVTGGNPGLSWSVTYDASSQYFMYTNPGNGGPTLFPFYVDIDYFNIDCASALPVELTYFDGECGSLSWQTASETNNDYFLIAESLDGIVWRNIESLEGQGTTTETTDYAIDITGSNTMYYRLTQVDFDGASEVFPIISVNCNVGAKEVSGYYDLMGRSVNQENVRGYYLVLYTDGSTEKKYK